ncbi:MAG: hypothetical protein OER96_01965 [Gammaproteobacteria bacterium]|nr:hypothetical protein [Gammaproteobacteria bacterium]
MPELSDIACPFCGLLCDDLEVSANGNELALSNNACAMSRRGFKEYDREFGPAKAIVNRDAKGSDEAIKHAADILANATSPLILVANTDVAGARSSVRLAEQCGGVIDHINSPALMRNVSVLQNSGWFTGTFAEVRNRSEIIVIVGDEIFDRYPRLIERVLLPERSLLESNLDKRKFAFIGPWNEKSLPKSLRAKKPIIIDTELSRAADVISLLRVMLSTGSINQFDIDLTLKEKLHNLFDYIKNSSYSSVIWAAGDFDFPHSDLLVQNLVEWVRSLNDKSRAIALPVGGTNGDLTLNQVCTWQSGLPIRTSFARGYPEHDLLLFDYRRLLKSGEADVLLIFGHSDLNIDITNELDCIMVGPKDIDTEKQIFIQTGLPGLHHSGHMFRGDGVVSIPLRQIQRTNLPSPAQVLDQISRHLDLK